MAISESNTTSSYKPYLAAAIELLTWPIIHWVQQDADITPLVPESNMNGIVHIYRKTLKKTGFIVNLGRSS
jgi:hypothetical protein